MYTWNLGKSKNNALIAVSNNSSRNKWQRLPVDKKTAPAAWRFCLTRRTRVAPRRPRHQKIAGRPAAFVHRRRQHGRRSKISDGRDHRHRIDKYLDTLLANQPISDGEATDRCQRRAPQDGGLPELIVARSCLTNHSEAASLWLVMPKQGVGDYKWRHEWRVVCCNVKSL